MCLSFDLVEVGDSGTCVKALLKFTNSVRILFPKGLIENTVSVKDFNTSVTFVTSKELRIFETVTRMAYKLGTKCMK